MLILEKEIVFAGADIVDHILVPVKCRLEAVYILSSAAITANGSNYLEFNVYGANGSDVVADRDTSSDDLAQLTGEEVAIDANQDQRVYEAGDYIKLEIDETGTFSGTPTIHFALKLALAR